MMKDVLGKDLSAEEIYQQLCAINRQGSLTDMFREFSKSTGIPEKKVRNSWTYYSRRSEKNPSRKVNDKLSKAMDEVLYSVVQRSWNGHVIHIKVPGNVDIQEIEILLIKQIQKQNV